LGLTLSRTLALTLTASSTTATAATLVAAIVVLRRCERRSNGTWSVYGVGSTMIERLAQCRLVATTTLNHGSLGLKQLEGLDCGSHHVDRIVAAERLGENVPDTGDLNHGTHGTTSDNAGTRTGWLEHYA
jgi:hypothetical protein